MEQCLIVADIPDALDKGRFSCALIPDHGNLGQWVDESFNTKIPQTLNALDELLYPSANDV